MSTERKLSAKAERTRTSILDAALELFRERGYDATTMRAVAERAGVSTGNAYYYYATKEHLVHGYYVRSYEEHAAVCAPILAAETDLATRLRGVLRTKVECISPYHRFAAGLFKSAASPDSPLNPFSEESRETREESIALMGEVLAGSRQKVPKDLAQELPLLLWLHLMGIILFWVHDRSPGAERTLRLVDRTTEIVVRLIKLASNPLLLPLRRSTLKLTRELRTDMAP